MFLFFATKQILVNHNVVLVVTKLNLQQHVLQMVYYFQWRIQDFPWGDANSQIGCANLLFANFCQKLYENERIWTRGEERVPGTPPWIRQ